MGQAAVRMSNLQDFGRKVGQAVTRMRMSPVQDFERRVGQAVI